MHDVTGFMCINFRMNFPCMHSEGDAKGRTYTQSKELEPLVDTCLLAVSCEQPMANNLLCS